MRLRHFPAALLALMVLGLPLGDLPASAYGWEPPPSVSVSVVPIVGYQRSQRVTPTPHTHDHLIYGARLTVGVPYLSGEAEYTRGTDSEDFPTQGVSTRDTDEALKIGLRSSYALADMLSVYARGGAQARRNRHEETRAGATTVTDRPTEWHPYAGGGVTARLAGNLSADFGITVVFRDFPDVSRNEYQTTAGLSIRYP
jgi:hypothetical protein